MRAKFRVHGVTFRGDHTNPDTPREYILGAVNDTTTPENERFTKATPWADLKMFVNNPAAVLVVGEEYYLDFTPCAIAEAKAKAEETVEDHSRDVAAPATMGNTHDVTGVYTPGQPVPDTADYMKSRGA